MSDHIHCDSCGGILPEHVEGVRRSSQGAPIPAWSIPPIIECDCPENEEDVE